MDELSSGSSSLVAVFSAFMFSRCIEIEMIEVMSVEECVSLSWNKGKMSGCHSFSIIKHQFSCCSAREGKLLQPIRLWPKSSRSSLWHPGLSAHSSSSCSSPPSCCGQRQPCSAGNDTSPQFFWDCVCVCVCVCACVCLPGEWNPTAHSDLIMKIAHPSSYHASLHFPSPPQSLRYTVALSTFHFPLCGSSSVLCWT